MPIKRLGGDEPLPRPPADRGRQGTTLGVAPAPVPSVQACSQCQAPAPSDGRFCGQCGGSVFTSIETVTTPVAPSRITVGGRLQAPPIPPPIERPAPTAPPAAAPIERLPSPTRGRRKGIGTLMGEDVEARIKLTEEARRFKIFLGCLVFFAAVILVIWVITSTPSRSSEGHPSGVSISVPLADAGTED